MTAEEPGRDIAAMTHEALDRVFVIHETFRTHVIEHPVVAENAALNSEAEAIEQAPAAFYQRIGRTDERAARAG